MTLCALSQRERLKITKPHLCSTLKFIEPLSKPSILRITNGISNFSHHRKLKKNNIEKRFNRESYAVHSTMFQSVYAPRLKRARKRKKWRKFVWSEVFRSFACFAFFGWNRGRCRFSVSAMKVKKKMFKKSETLVKFVRVLWDVLVDAALAEWEWKAFRQDGSTEVK